jgi:hypothetical protein
MDKDDDDASDGVDDDDDDGDDDDDDDDADNEEEDGVLQEQEEYFDEEASDDEYGLGNHFDDAVDDEDDDGDATVFEDFDAYVRCTDKLKNTTKSNGKGVGSNKRLQNQLASEDEDETKGVLPLVCLFLLHYL